MTVEERLEAFDAARLALLDELGALEPAVLAARPRAVKQIRALQRLLA